MELEHVHSVYSKITRHFHTTRFAIWNCVAQFLDSVSTPNTLLFGLDVGCGNGKYERYLSTHSPKTYMVACDVCKDLLQITANSKCQRQDCLLANGLDLPYKSATFDFAISIAVIHHLSTPEKRIRFLQEILRCTKPKARILITAWAAEQPIKPKWKLQPEGTNDYLIPWTDRFTNTIHYRYYHLFSRQEIDQLLSALPDAEIIKITYEKDNWCVELSHI